MVMSTPMNPSIEILRRWLLCLRGVHFELIYLKVLLFKFFRANSCYL